MAAITTTTSGEVIESIEFLMLSMFARMLSETAIVVHTVCMPWQRQSLHTSQVAHQAGAYLGFCSMKQLGVFLLSPGWDASPSQGYPRNSLVPIYTPGWREALGVKCLAQEHNTLA